MTVSTVSKWHFKISWYDNWHVKVRIWLEYVKIKTTSEFSAPTSRIRILGVYIYIKFFRQLRGTQKPFWEKKWSSIIGTTAFECSGLTRANPSPKRTFPLPGWQSTYTHTYPSPPSCILSTRNQSKRPTVNQTDPRHAFVWAKGRISALQEQHTWSDPFVINLIVFLGFSNHSWTNCR